MKTPSASVLQNGSECGGALSFVELGFFTGSARHNAPCLNRRLIAQPAQASSLELFDNFILSSDSGFAAAAKATTYLRCGSASDRHSSITLSNVLGLKGLRRQRVAPSLSAIFKKSGLDASRLEKA